MAEPEVSGAFTRPQQVALGSLVTGALIFVAKLIAGILTGSLGLLSEAAHSGLDVIASGFALLAVRTARRPADAEHLYGHGRVENLAAFTEGILLILTAGGIYIEAIRRLLSGSAVVDASYYAMAVLGVAVVIEGVRGVLLRWAGRVAGSDALTADAQNRWADVLSSLGVLAGLVGVRAGYTWADSVAALVVATLIAVTAARILRHSGDELMDRAPAGAEADLRGAIGAVSGVREVRAVRVRRSGGRLIGDARVSARRTLSVEGAQALTDEVQRVIAMKLPDVDLVLAVEGQLEQANLVERIHASAARLGAFRDLHNVTVEKEGDGTLHLTMHAKLPNNLSLHEAGDLSSRLEANLRAELPEANRIDIHLEPLEEELVTGRDVTAAHADLVQRIHRLAADHHDIVRCLDVELSSRDGRITAHVVVEMASDVSLERAHLVEEELERKILVGEPALEEVVTRAMS
ncbi:MAG: cation diffusion facilitator family transporter [Candidatus Dormibacteraeota bacterium]|nr:cation diffusion facilitator family transporter [Candidatus Dormibacteraeota bacterium]